jgi:hypothetical protein
MSDHREDAKRLLVHYFDETNPKGRGKLDSDSFVEIREIVDHIVDAAKQELRAEMAALTRRVSATEVA